ncbi:MAG: hypothetical protein GSR80_001437 [Desulfurococcales archaeon]|nr:hypothetical protein [Desulfurococcales archaeon]
MAAASRAVETARRALPYVVVGPPIIHRGPAGDVHVDLPLIYQGFALDRIHYDPVSRSPSPKGRPVHAMLRDVDPSSIAGEAEAILGELRVLDAAEYRGPEAAWAVPVAWRSFIVAHIKVSGDGGEIVPDYGLTEEVRRLVG